jgi:putative transposase
MHPCRSKTCYHPYLLVAFHLNCLPENMLQIIPRSTRFDWDKRDLQSSFGYDWFLENKDLFHTLQLVAINKKLISINRVFLRVIAVKRFIKENATGIRAGRMSLKTVVVSNIQKVGGIVGITKALRYLDLNFQQYTRLKRNITCSSFVLNLCRIKHPAQLLQKEIEIIKTYCLQPGYQFWSLCSLYHQMRKDGAAHMRLSTFYKYVSLLNLKRSRVFSRRKNHTLGIRATAPFQVLHADLTEFKTEDQKKAYIYLVQDNYSRTILGYQLSLERRACHTFENLSNVKAEYLVPAKISECMLLTDDGSENYGIAKQLITESDAPKIRHVIAQADIPFSNSMIEAANKQLKYRFLYHQKINNFSNLENYLSKAILDFNHRPHGVLNGLSPMEVLQGKIYDKENQNNLLSLSVQRRISENQQLKCCAGSF